MSATISTKGLGDALKYFNELPDVASMAAVLAINQVATGTGMTLLKTETRKQVLFPTGYLEAGRLRVTRKATRGSLEAVISGRDRPTSLARFAQGATVANSRKGGVRVQVKPGGAKRNIKRGFIIKLKNGNLGLAIRVKQGETLERSTGAKLLAKNLYLLYGPSVDQVFRGVAEQNAPVIGDQVINQFYRQFARLARG